MLQSETKSDAGVQRLYTVVQGDSLASIATAFSTTVEAIQSVNPSITDTNRIAIGQVVAIPQARAGDLREFLGNKNIL